LFRILFETKYRNSDNTYYSLQLETSFSLDYMADIICDFIINWKWNISRLLKYSLSTPIVISNFRGIKIPLRISEVP